MPSRKGAGAREGGGGWKRGEGGRPEGLEDV